MLKTEVKVSSYLKEVGKEETPCSPQRDTASLFGAPSLFFQSVPNRLAIPPTYSSPSLLHSYVAPADPALAGYTFVHKYFAHLEENNLDMNEHTRIELIFHSYCRIISFSYFARHLPTIQELGYLARQWPLEYRQKILNLLLPHYKQSAEVFERALVFPLDSIQERSLDQGVEFTF